KVKDYEVIKTVNYKKRGTKVYLKDLNHGYETGLWQNEYKHEIEVLNGYNQAVNNTLDFNSALKAKNDKKEQDLWLNDFLKNVIPQLTRDEKAQLLKALENGEKEK